MENIQSFLVCIEGFLMGLTFYYAIHIGETAAEYACGRFGILAGWLMLLILIAACTGLHISIAQPPEERDLRTVVLCLSITAFFSGVCIGTAIILSKLRREQA